MVKSSVKKRFRLTKNGKLLRRSMALDHFRTRKTKKNLRNKRKTSTTGYPAKKILGY